MSQRARATAVVVALVAASVPVLLPESQVAQAAPGDIVATSVTSIFLGRGIDPEVSADGRFIAFNERAQTGLRIGEPTVAGATQVALNGQNVVADSPTAPAGMSANGRHVVFISDATNLVPTDNTARLRVYTLDRDTDEDGIYDEPGYTTLRRIPGRVAPQESSGGWARADISNDGRYVAFTQPDVDGSNSCLRAYRYDRDADADGVFDEPGATTTVDVTVSSAGTPGSRAAGCFRSIPFDPDSLAISGDGQHVAFTSNFDNLVAGDGNQAYDVFVRDLTTNTTVRVPTSPGNVNGPNTLQGALGGISGNGRYVVVTANANGTDYVFRHDRDSDGDSIFDEPGATADVTVSTVPFLGQTPSISGDGGTVAFWSTTGIQVWRPTIGLVAVLPVTLANAGGAVALNASGNVLALSTREPYDAADANAQEDVYRVELSAGPPVALNVSVSSPATTPPAASEIPITNISPQTIRAANFDVSAAPGGGVKRAPGGGVKRAPGGGVKRAPGGGVKRAPGGGVKRADELSNFAAAFGRVPAINNLPLSSIPILGGWDALLPLSLQGRPLQSLTFGQVLAAIGPGTVQLEQLDLTNTPIADLSAAAFGLGGTPLNQLLIDSSTLWCTKLTQLTTRSCVSLGITNQTTLIELEMRAETRQILADFPSLVRIPLAINVSVLRSAGAPILQETMATLGLGVSKVGDLPVSAAIAATPGIGSLTVADIGNTTLTLDCIIGACASGTTLSSLQASGQIQARARLRDFTSAISSKKLDDIVAALPADITLNDVLIGLLEAQDFPWEAVDLVTSGIQDAASSPTTVSYSVTVAASGGTGPFDGNVEVVLPAGWRLVPGTSSVSPAIALPLSEPSRAYTHTDTRLGFRLTGFMPGVAYTIGFQARPGFVLGTVAANATADSAGVSGNATPTPITILEPSDTSADPNTAPTLQSDRLYIAYTTAANDVDLFRFNPPPGKVVSVWLSNFDKDADLSLYGPAPDAAGAPGSPSATATRGPAPATAPLPDEGTTAVGGASIAEPQSERDVPSVAGTTLLGTSANADVDVEGVSAVNANLIQVAPYQGATSTGPYVVRVRVDDTEAAGACTYTRSGGVQGPAFDVNSLPGNLETAILVNQRRLGDAMLPAQALDLITNSLVPLSTAPGVNGAIVYLDSVVDYTALDANWCSPDANNDVVRQVGALIDQIRDARPSLRHLVIVGGDDIVPMARVNDVTRTGNEAQYADELLSGNGGQTTPLTEALGTRHFLTDDPYGDLDPIAWFNRRLYVPDLAVGRLVESHDEIAATVAAYLDPNGDGNTTDAGVMPASATYMTGYDFMADGATATRAALDAALTLAGGAAPASTKNISPPDALVTKTQVLTGAAGGRAVGLFGHFAHDGALTDAGFRSNSGENFTPTELAAALRPASTPANARLVFSIGCHSGLNVTDGPAGSTDFAQKVLGTGAVYVAMTTYGYGAQGVVGLNEALMAEFASQLDGSYVLINPSGGTALANRRYLSIGEAFVAAKQEYFSSQGLYGAYDEKSLEAATFFGLPMYRVGQSGPQRTAAAPEVPTAVGGSAAYSAVDQSQTFSPAAVAGANGTYYTVPGFDPQVAANRPVQPRFETDVTAVDTGGGLLYAKGVLVTDLDTAAAVTIDPVVTRPVLDSATNEPEIGVGDIAYPSVPASITTYTDALGYSGDNTVLQRQKLVIVPGQFLNNATVDSAGDGTQVLYGKIDTRVTYSDSTDWDRPAITSTIGTLNGGTAAFSVKAADAAGVQRVLVLYRTDVSDWAALDLSLSGNEWQGDVQVPGATTFDYLVQVVDVNGNIATSTGKGRGLDPVVALIPDPATVSIASGSSLEGDAGSTNQALQIVLDRPAPAPITVNYTVSPGTATSGVDYSAANGSASFAAGDLAASIPITVLGDTAVEAPESVLVALTGVVGAGVLGDSAATFTIVDDDAAGVVTTLVNAGDITVVEGNSGSQVANVPVTLGPAAGGAVTLNWSVTAAGTATVGSDVLAPTSGVVTVPAGSTTAAIPITIAGDAVVEPNETVVVQVTSTTGGVSVVDGTAVVTITDDDVVPSASIGDVTVSESSATAEATVTLSAASAQPVTVTWQTTDGSATAASDYVASSGTVTITTGTTGVITVPLFDDGVSEPTESFAVTLTGSTAATIADGSATVTINDDDLLLISAGDTSIVEGNAPGTVAVTVTLDHPSQVPVSVDWATANGTASAPSDFTASAGTLTIASGTTGVVNVPIVGDTAVEPGEAFIVTISNATFGTITQAVATVTIVDDDIAVAPSVLGASPITVAEGTSGTATIANVPISISPATSGPVTVAYTISAVTATAGDDFLAATGTLSIPSGATSAAVPVSIVADAIDDAAVETVVVTLGAVTGNAALGASPAATVTIADDDATPTITVAAVSVPEPGAPTAVAITAAIDVASQLPVSFQWATAGGTATAGADHTAASGVATILPGATSTTFAVTVLPDAIAEPTETVLIALTNALNGVLAAPSATLSINDDDPLTISTSGISITEGNAPSTASITVTLNRLSEAPVSIAWATGNGSAVAPSDYAASSGTLVISGGTTGTISVPIVGDTAVEADENFTVNLTGASAGSITQATATVTITNDDVVGVTPQLSVSDASILEASGGTRTTQVRASLAAPRLTGTTFTWRTRNGTATAPSDYAAEAARTATIPAGATSVLLTVTTKGDTVDELDEYFEVVISAPPAGVTLADPIGRVTILDDDPRPTVSIADASVVEGNSGTRDLVFTITLSAPTGDTVAFGWATDDGTARRTDNDYQGAAGIVTFNPGETTRTITVRVNGDTRVEANETFRVQLALLVSATFARSSAKGTITNDD